MLERIRADATDRREQLVLIFRAKYADLNPASVAKGRHGPVLQRTYSAICPGLGGGTPGLPERSSLSFRSMDRQ